MKKTLITLSLILSANLLAVDVSVDTSQTEKRDTDQAMSFKESKDNKKTEGARESDTTTTDKSHSKSFDLTKNGQVEVLEAIKKAEGDRIKPFYDCSILTHPKLAKDFRLTAQDEDGSIDTIFADILQKAATFNAPINSVGADEYEVKDYMNCVAYYGAVIADSLKHRNFSTQIRDEKIANTFKLIQEDLAHSECRFDSAVTTIICESVELKIGYRPNLSYANIDIYSNQTYFGFSATAKVSDSKSKRVAFESQTSKERARTVSLTKDDTTTERGSTSEDVAAKTNFSPRNWLPK